MKKDNFFVDLAIRYFCSKNNKNCLLAKITKIIVLMPTVINSFPTSGHFFCLLITFANSLDPDQARQNVGLIWIQTVRHSDGIPEDCFEKVIF